MILVKTPFRISLVGGGTDLPQFYERNGFGAVVSGAIDRYMYVMIHPYFYDKLRIRYSMVEDVAAADEVKHPIARECLRMMGVNSGVEIASIADIPAGLGLGSSSSFTVCLLHALHTFRGAAVSKPQLAAEACLIEIDRLGEPIGKQDQYAACFGGLNYIQFNADGSVDVSPIVIPRQAASDLAGRLLVFSVGTARAARDVLSEQRSNLADATRFSNAQHLARLARDMRHALETGAPGLVGEILAEGWLRKKELASGVTNPVIDEAYERGLAAGATGGKLLGAGSGGFLLLYCEPHLQDRVRAALGLRELGVHWDFEGSKVIYYE